MNARAALQYASVLAKSFVKVPQSTSSSQKKTCDD